MFSKFIFGTNRKTTKMSWVEYIFTHVIPTWGQVFSSNFRLWAHLMTDNYDNYALLKDDDPFTECNEWFWASLNEDEVYPKEFLEYLLQLSEEVKLGKVETYPWDKFIEDLELLEVDNLQTGPADPQEP